MTMSNKTYDILKKISLMIVPIVTLITALTEIWGFAYGAEIAATVSAVGVCLGACLAISSKNYKPDDEKVEYDEGY